MRYIALVLLLIMAPLPAHARCAGYHENLLTPLLVAGTGMIVLEVGGFHSALAADVLELRAANGKSIPIELRATHGGVHQRQLVVVPKSPLAPGRYMLRRIAKDEHRHEAHEVVVLSLADATRQWPATCSAKGCDAITPVIGQSQSQREELGCGPAESIDVQIGNRDEWLRPSSTAAKKLAFVTLTDVASKQTQSGFADVVPAGESENGATIGIGHGMCSGEFNVATDARYDATISIVGPDGVLGPSSSLELSYQPSK